MDLILVGTNIAGLPIDPSLALGLAFVVLAVLLILLNGAKAKRT